MLKYENLANIGDTIRGYDFMGTKGAYLEGKVIDKGAVLCPKTGVELFKGYTIDVEEDGAGFGRDNDIAYIPFETTMDYDGRVELIEEDTAGGVLRYLGIDNNDPQYDLAVAWMQEVA